ncbi:hypothetical protein FXW78_50345 [Rhodococcus opacus]|nr:hypothetical protein [Rhodococcus opacus]
MQGGQTLPRRDHRHVTDGDPQPGPDRRRAALDGIYTLRTTATPDELDTAAVIDAYKNLSRVERDFRSLKAIDLDLRPDPPPTRTTGSARPRCLICMLAAYLTWHLRRALPPLTFTDEHPPTRTDPVAAAAPIGRRQQQGGPQATTEVDLPVRSTRPARAPGDPDPQTTSASARVPDGAHAHRAPPIPNRRAFDLLGTTIPLNLQ